MPSNTVPFEYSIRTSKRVRNVRIAIKPYHGLEVVIPLRFPKKQIPRILQQHEDWITKQLAKHKDNLKSIRLPESLSLAFINKTYVIQFIEANQIKLIDKDPLLIIRYPTQQLAIKHLRSWIRNIAKELLVPALVEVADELGFEFKKTTIRSQKSRWGSCSSSGTISLNDQLLFMPGTTVRYLMIHELCHTRHMNHSKRFWQLVETCCPDFRAHEHILNNGRKAIPGWFLHSLHIRP